MDNHFCSVLSTHKAVYNLKKHFEEHGSVIDFPRKGRSKTVTSGETN